LNSNLQLLFASIFVFAVMFAMISDFSKLRIPNVVSIILILAFGGYALLGGVPTIWPHLIVAGAVFAILFVCFALSWVGAGDVKFITAVTLWAGPSHGMIFMLLFAIFGGVFAALLMGLRSALRYYPPIANVPVLDKFSRWARNGLCPYGIPIGVAALCIAPSIFAMR
jgi:prepilin peptidase CpaA